jgi:hypothetical protein
MIPISVDVDGQDWRYVFTNPDGCLKHQDRQHLVSETIRLYRDGKNRRRIKGRGFEGELRKGKYVSFNSWGGVEYLAKLETDKGDVKAGLMVIEKIDPSMN